MYLKIYRYTRAYETTLHDYNYNYTATSTSSTRIQRNGSRTRTRGALCLCEPRGRAGEGSEIIRQRIPGEYQPWLRLFFNFERERAMIWALLLLLLLWLWLMLVTLLPNRCEIRTVMLYLCLMFRSMDWHTIHNSYSLASRSRSHSHSSVRHRPGIQPTYQSISFSSYTRAFTKIPGPRISYKFIKYEYLKYENTFELKTFVLNGIRQGENSVLHWKLNWCVVVINFFT